MHEFPYVTLIELHWATTLQHSEMLAGTMCLVDSCSVLQQLLHCGGVAGLHCYEQRPGAIISSLADISVKSNQTKELSICHCLYVLLH